MTIPNNFPKVALVIKLSNGIDIIGCVQVNPHIAMFLEKNLDFAVLPHTTYIANVRIINGGIPPAVSFAKYNVWDVNDDCIVTISDQQIISICVPTNDLVNAFAANAGIDPKTLQGVKTDVLGQRWQVSTPAS